MKFRQLPIAIAVLGAVLVAGLPEAGIAQPGSKVAQAVLDRIADEGRARVVVEVSMPGAQGQGAARRSANAQAAIAAQQDRLLNELGGDGYEVVHRFGRTPFLALDVDAAALAELEAADTALSVVEDRLFSMTLMDSVPKIEADLAHQGGLDGTGNVIAVIDSGVDSAHPFLAGKVIAEACFASPESGGGGDCPNGQATQIGTGAAEPCGFAPQACRHGTHVAGIAAGSGATFTGVAPGANLIPIQVFHASTDCIFLVEEFPCPRAFESDIVAGLEHVYDLRAQYNIAAVNMSLGGTAYDAACDVESPLFAAAIDNLKSVDIATVAASGNDGLTIGIAEPACVSSAVAVGASDSNDQVAWFSNNSADLDLLAPGTPIYSSVTGGGFDVLEGTSMAAPHVAGAWAVYKQGVPGATVDQALAQFVSTGLLIDDYRGGPTKPRIRVGLALGFEPPVPDITMISPSSVIAYGPDFTLTVDGAGFVSASVIQLDGVDQPTTYVSDTQLAASIPASMIQTANTSFAVTVFTPAPGGGTSNAVTLDVVMPNPQITVDTTNVESGDPITATLTGSPGGPWDILTLAEVGSAPNSYVALEFVGTGVNDRTWTVNAPTTPGDYEFRLFLNSDFGQLFATSPAVTVDPAPPPPGSATLTLSTPTAEPGDSVTVTVTDAPSETRDLLTLAAVGSAPNAYLNFTFVGIGVTDTTWTVNAPTTPGDYEFRLFADNDFSQLIGVSGTLTVEEPPPPTTNPTLTLGVTNVDPGDSVTVTLADGPGNSNDLMTLAAVGSAPAAYVNFTFVGDGVTDRTWTVNAPSTPGDYEFRLFANNDFGQQLAVSTTLTVDEPPPPATNPTLTLTVASVEVGDPVTVTLADGPGNSNDLMTLAAVGSAPAAYVNFTFVGDGVTDRTWTVNAPSTPGQYEFRLFANNDFNQQLAVSATLTVEEPPPPPSNPTLTLSVANAEPGDPVTVTLADGPGNSNDLMTLAAVGSAPNAYVNFTFVGDGVTDRTWTVNAPAAGQYEFRLFANNDFGQQLAVSATLTVEDPPPPPSDPTLTVSVANAETGDPITVTLADGPGNSNDLMTFAAVGSAPNAYVNFTFVGDGVTDRTWTVNAPSTPGQYEFRLFANNDFGQQLAVSAVVTVEEPPPPTSSPTITLSTDTAAPRQRITATLAGAPSESRDIMTIAPVGSPMNSYLNFKFVNIGITDLVWSLRAPNSTGQYEIRLFLNNDFSQLAAVSPILTVEVP